MRIKRGYLAILVCTSLLSMAAVPLPANSTAEQTLPRVFVSDTTFHFGPVVDGISVEHDFIVENRGTAPLNISTVRTG
jgi:hypothetical protein